MHLLHGSPASCWGHGLNRGPNNFWMRIFCSYAVIKELKTCCATSFLINTLLEGYVHFHIHKNSCIQSLFICLRLHSFPYPYLGRMVVSFLLLFQSSVRTHDNGAGDKLFGTMQDGSIVSARQTAGSHLAPRCPQRDLIFHRVRVSMQ